MDIEKLQQDFRRFIKYYDEYSTKKFADVFPQQFVDWTMQ